MDISFYTADGIFIKQFVLLKKGDIAPQHSHVHSHTTMLALGTVRLYCENDGFIGDYHAPTGIPIPAGKMHEFVALEDNTILYCIHNTEMLEVLEHNLE